MKAITLTPPYGSLIALAAAHPELGKNIETRSWATKYRGPLAIHQAVSLKPVGGQAGLYDLAFGDPDGFFSAALHTAHMFCIDDLPRGRIVATCELLDCVDTELISRAHGWYRGQMHWPLTDQERAFGDYRPGRYAWLLGDIRALPVPIAARGYQRIWNWEGALT